MPVKVIAIAFGVLVSLINFLIVVYLSVKAQKKKTTTAAATIVASFITRLTLLFFIFLGVVRNPVWSKYIYPIVGGFIIAHLLLMMLEIKILLMAEAKSGFKKELLSID